MMRRTAALGFRMNFDSVCQIRRLICMYKSGNPRSNAPQNTYTSSWRSAKAHPHRVLIAAQPTPRNAPYNVFLTPDRSVWPLRLCEHVVPRWTVCSTRCPGRLPDSSDCKYPAKLFLPSSDVEVFSRSMLAIPAAFSPQRPSQRLMALS